mgnify:CR=1 FL=1
MGRTSGRHAIHTQRRGFTSQTVEIETSSAKDAADLALTMKIAETLERHYPGHPWMVQVSHDSGCAFIKLPIVMRSMERYVLHIDKLNMDPSMRAVVRAGGELLERFNMPRTGFSLDPFLDARAKGPYGRKAAPRIVLE